MVDGPVLDLSGQQLKPSPSDRSIFPVNSNVYFGPSAFSEAETRNVKRLLCEHDQGPRRLQQQLRPCPSATH